MSESNNGDLPNKIVEEPTAEDLNNTKEQEENVEEIQSEKAKSIGDNAEVSSK